LDKSRPPPPTKLPRGDVAAELRELVKDLEKIAEAEGSTLAQFLGAPKAIPDKPVAKSSRRIKWRKPGKAK
jgi:hypothetical protein